ncbi:RNA-binding protein YlmH, contains S4-like domain [Streptococcus henryi]|uniref:RNA-binding protein YlmH, contains S4-like domain n=2 Tax=Streptococcus henryi TaxID=439219 RepID=A0A1G6DKN8_9STRE|nr:RNA-binding protein [Streptococcus henryi]SDB45744.1 RNA-binding protein YlmH, contains S4-like domain [Streptococcus henryi]
MVQNSLYQHYRKEEYDFVDKVRDLINKVESTYTMDVTEFFNPRQVEIVKSLCHYYGVQVFASSDYYDMEYAKVIIAPEYYVFDFLDFNIALVEISYNAKFNQLTHSQIMGTLINQLGIKRTVFGDILVQSDRAQLLVDRSMLSYFTSHIAKIGRASVTLKEIDFSKLLVPESQSQSIEILVSSMRLDKVLAAVLKISRSQSTKLIEADKVKVNYRQSNKISEMLQIGDKLSIRGFGRFSIVSDNGLSKNGKYKLTIDKMIHK